jgi:hypothetical protein
MADASYVAPSGSVAVNMPQAAPSLAPPPRKSWRGGLFDCFGACSRALDGGGAERRAAGERASGVGLSPSRASARAPPTHQATAPPATLAPAAWWHGCPSSPSGAPPAARRAWPTRTARMLPQGGCGLRCARDTRRIGCLPWPAPPHAPPLARHTRLRRAPKPKHAQGVRAVLHQAGAARAGLPVRRPVLLRRLCGGRLRAAARRGGPHGRRRLLRRGLHGRVCRQAVQRLHGQGTHHARKAACARARPRLRGAQAEFLSRCATTHTV